MKKIMLLCSGLLLAVMLTACGGQSGKENGTETGTQQTQESSSVQQTQTPGTDNSQTPETDNGTNGTGNNGAEGTLQELRTAVTDVLGENYWPNTVIEAEVLADQYGITEEMYDEFFGEMPMISVNVDTLLIIKAKEGQEQAVEDALNAYREAQINDAMQYPMNVGKVQASRIEAIGSYICFVQLGADVTEEMDQGEDAVITKCQEANEAALDAIRSRLLQ